MSKEQRRPISPTYRGESFSSEFGAIMESRIPPEKIRSLWLDKDFPGHGLGLLAFKQELESRFHVTLSDKYVKNVMLRVPEYVQNIIRRKKIDRRNYDSVHGFFELVQVDLAEFPQFSTSQSEKGWRYVFCAIDVYTSFLWTKVLKEKNSETVQNAFDELFREYGSPQKLESDQAGELKKLKSEGYFESRKVYFHFKRPPNKCAFAGKLKNILAFHS